MKRVQNSFKSKLKEKQQTTIAVKQQQLTSNNLNKKRSVRAWGEPLKICSIAGRRCLLLPQLPPFLLPLLRCPALLLLLLSRVTLTPTRVAFCCAFFLRYRQYFIFTLTRLLLLFHVAFTFTFTFCVTVAGLCSALPPSPLLW